MTDCRLFLTPEALESWLSRGRAEVVGNEMLDTSTGMRFTLREGVRFVCELTGTEDTSGLVGKVKDVDQLNALGAEHVADSVVLGDHAYTVVEGFIGSPVPAAPVLVPPIDASPRQTLQALQAFFLTNVK